MTPFGSERDEDEQELDRSTKKQRKKRCKRLQATDVEVRKLRPRRLDWRNTAPPLCFEDEQHVFWKRTDRDSQERWV